jgi:hypothetical protein
MPKFGEEYTSNYAYFIAGGETLEIIEQFEKDAANRDALQNAIALEHGAKAVEIDGIHGFRFLSDREINDPALVFDKSYSGLDASKVYLINEKTDEGKALRARLDDVPSGIKDHACFAQRLLADKDTDKDKAYVLTNPDRLLDDEGRGGYEGHYKVDNQKLAVSYSKHGNVYLVKVPHVIHGIGIQFNEAASDRTATGYGYDWFKPPGSDAIPDYVALAIKQVGLGDQTKPQQVKTKPGRTIYSV